MYLMLELRSWQITEVSGMKWWEPPEILTWNAQVGMMVIWGEEAGYFLS